LADTESNAEVQAAGDASSNGAQDAQEQAVQTTATIVTDSQEIVGDGDAAKPPVDLSEVPALIDANAD